MFNLFLINLLKNLSLNKVDIDGHVIGRTIKRLMIDSGYSLDLFSLKLRWKRIVDL